MQKAARYMHMMLLVSKCNGRAN